MSGEVSQLDPSSTICTVTSRASQFLEDHRRLSASVYRQRPFLDPSTRRAVFRPGRRPALPRSLQLFLCRGSGLEKLPLTCESVDTRQYVLVVLIRHRVRSGDVDVESFHRRSG